MPARLSKFSIVKCFLRSNMMNVAYNLRGLQNLGFTYSLLPGLRDLYPGEREFAGACRRYATFHNCHPFWGPFLTGAFLELEARTAAGRLDPALTAPVKETLLNSLSGIGDSFFSGSMDIVFFLILACLATQGHFGLACAGLAFWLITAVLMKIFTFALGLKRGFQAVAWLPRLNLINLGDYFKIFGALVLIQFLAMSLRIYSDGHFANLSLLEVLYRWIFPLGLLMVFSYLAARLHYSRSLLLTLLLLLAWLGL